MTACCSINIRLFLFFHFSKSNMEHSGTVIELSFKSLISTVLQCFHLNSKPLNKDPVVHSPSVALSQMPSLTLNEQNPLSRHIDKKEETAIGQEADDLHSRAVTHWHGEIDIWTAQRRNLFLVPHISSILILPINTLCWRLPYKEKPPLYSVRMQVRGAGSSIVTHILTSLGGRSIDNPKLCTLAFKRRT